MRVIVAFVVQIALLAADVFFLFFAPTPLCFAGPVNLAVFAAASIFIRHLNTSYDKVYPLLGQKSSLSRILMGELNEQKYSRA